MNGKAVVAAVLASPIDEIVAAELLANPRSRVEYWQWMRNAEGGQAYGNQQIIKPLDRTTFDYYAAHGNTYDEYKKQHPETVYVSLLKIGSDDWIIVGADSDPSNLRPSAWLSDQGNDPRWAKKVRSLSSREAKSQGSTADNELDYPGGISPRGRFDENPYPVGSKSIELNNWSTIKRQHPDAIVRSRTTGKGVVRLAIYGSGKDKTVKPISFTRNNPDNVYHTIGCGCVVNKYTNELVKTCNRPIKLINGRYVVEGCEWKATKQQRDDWKEIDEQDEQSEENPVKNPEAFGINESEQSHTCAQCHKRIPKGSKIVSGAYDPGYKQQFFHPECYGDNRVAYHNPSPYTYYAPKLQAINIKANRLFETGDILQKDAGKFEKLAHDEWLLLQQAKNDPDVSEEQYKMLEDIPGSGSSSYMQGNDNPMRRNPSFSYLKREIQSAHTDELHDYIMNAKEALKDGDITSHQYQELLSLRKQLATVERNPKTQVKVIIGGLVGIISLILLQRFRK